MKRYVNNVVTEQSSLMIRDKNAWKIYLCCAIEDAVVAYQQERVESVESFQLELRADLRAAELLCGRLSTDVSVIE